MEKIYTGEKPQDVVPMGARKRINYGVWELSEAEVQALWEAEREHTAPYDYFAQQHRYGYYTLVIGGAQWNKSGVVDAIIRDRYREDEMEAITNNMTATTSLFLETLVTGGITSAIKVLKESIDEDKSATFAEMQNWRKMAKEWAKRVFEQIE